MSLCKKCGLNVCQPCVPALQNPKLEIVVVASDRALSRVSHFHRLALAAGELGLSRREIPNWIADAVFGFEGRIVWPNGDPFHLSDTAVDDAFNDDGSFRWLSDFLHFAEIPPRQRPQERVLPRLRLIDLAFRINHPERAALIAK